MSPVPAVVYFSVLMFVEIQVCLTGDTINVISKFEIITPINVHFTTHRIRTYKVVPLTHFSNSSNPFHHTQDPYIQGGPSNTYDRGVGVGG